MANQVTKLKLQALRGATTCSNNSPEEIQNAVKELIDQLIQRNSLKAEEIVSIIFSATKDLNCCYPASIARRNKDNDQRPSRGFCNNLSRLVCKFIQTFMKVFSSFSEIAPSRCRTMHWPSPTRAQICNI